MAVGNLSLPTHHYVSFCPDELKNLVDAQCLELKAKGISLGFLEKKHSDASSLSQPDFTSLIHLTRSVQLWPAMEYLAVLWQYKATADFMTQACLRRWAILLSFEGTYFLATLFHVPTCKTKHSLVLRGNSCWGRGGRSVATFEKAKTSWRYFACFDCYSKSSFPLELLAGFKINFLCVCSIFP